MQMFAKSHLTTLAKKMKDATFLLVFVIGALSQRQSRLRFEAAQIWTSQPIVAVDDDSSVWNSSDLNAPRRRTLQPMWRARRLCLRLSWRELNKKKSFNSYVVKRSKTNGWVAIDQRNTHRHTCVCVEHRLVSSFFVVVVVVVKSVLSARPMSRGFGLVASPWYLYYTGTWISNWMDDVRTSSN